MKYETDLLPVGADETDDQWGGNGRAAAQGAGPALPPGTVMADRAAGWLRRFLDGRGLGAYRLFTAGDMDLHDLDDHAAELGAGAWEPAPSLVPGGAAAAMLPSRRSQRARPAGALVLPKHDAVVARFWWYDTGDAAWYSLWLFAAPSAEHYARVREAVRELRRRPEAAAWQVVSGSAWRDGERLGRDGGRFEDLILAEAVRDRLEAEVVGFFSERAAALYRKLGVDYRRGVLLYGPPGNGKTSIIRALAARLPAVSGFVLRATGSVDDDDFTTVVRRWAAAAPAILVIEDLNWLFPDRVNISTFLNLLDGLETPREGGGLMLVASTNHPETLDPALSDRPGRFDVAMELPSPDAGLRRQFFRRALGGGDGGGAEVPPEEMLAKLASATAGLSFAPLREVVQSAGLTAIRAGRESRTEGDLMSAAEAVARAHRAAGFGFPVQCEEPFGLAQFRAAGGAGEAGDHDE